VEEEEGFSVYTKKIEKNSSRQGEEAFFFQARSR